MSATSGSGESVRISSWATPSANMPRMSATRMRIPRIQACPPPCWGLKVIRFLGLYSCLTRLALRVRFDRCMGYEGTRIPPSELGLRSPWPQGGLPAPPGVMPGATRPQSRAAFVRPRGPRGRRSGWQTTGVPGVAAQAVRKRPGPDWPAV